MNAEKPFDITAQQAASAQKAEKAKLAGLTEDADWVWLLSQPQGRRIVRDLLEECGVYRTSFTGNSTTFFNEGRRQVGLVIVGKVHQYASDQYVPMLKERRVND